MTNLAVVATGAGGGAKDRFDKGFVKFDRGSLLTFNLGNEIHEDRDKREKALKMGPLKKLPKAVLPFAGLDKQ